MFVFMCCIASTSIHPHTIHLRPTSVAWLRPPLTTPVRLSSGWMHPTHLSCSLGNFSRNLPEATFGIASANFHYKTKEMSGTAIRNLAQFNKWGTEGQSQLNLSWIRWGFPPLQTPLKVFLSQCTYTCLLSLHPYPCHCFPSLSPQHPQGTEQLLSV